MLQAKRAKLFRLGQKLNSILFVVYSLLRPDTNKYVLLGWHPRSNLTKYDTPTLITRHFVLCKYLWFSNFEFFYLFYLFWFITSFIHKVRSSDLTYYMNFGDLSNTLECGPLNHRNFLIIDLKQTATKWLQKIWIFWSTR